MIKIGANFRTNNGVQEKLVRKVQHSTSNYCLVSLRVERSEMSMPL